MHRSDHENESKKRSSQSDICLSQLHFSYHLINEELGIDDFVPTSLDMYHITGTYWIAVTSAWAEVRGMRAELLVDFLNLHHPNGRG
jgi:hypothetical protein